ncbi:MAG: nucleotide exchange factor GrpE [Anaerolineae bacterium]
MAAERQEPVPAEGTPQTGMTAEESAVVTAEGPKPETLEAELERLRQELEAARAQAAEYLDGWQRTQAEFANYRKRQEAEFVERVRLNNAVLIARILPVLDDLERAIQTLPPGLQSLTWVEGIFLIQRKLEVILEAEGLKPIETAGKSFDPLYHEAVTYEDVPGYEEGQIIGEVQRGYMLGDRVLRPALVRVARATPSDTSRQESA